MSINTLREMLTYRRPAGSTTERTFREQFILPLTGANNERAHYDDAGNIHVHVSDDPILWSAHTDTVHRSAGRQHVAHSGAWLELPDGSASNCLGADDTAGCYLLREMIRARVPGHYIFHFGEERGGIGSSWLARHYAEWLSTFKVAIALDRASTGDVITHQGGGRTASDTFARALATALGPCWEPTHGVYTDTAEYADLIAECTNLSVGYWAAHSADERLYIPHVYDLLIALLSLDVLSLPIARDPHAPDPDGRWTIIGTSARDAWWSATSWCDTCDYMDRNRFRGICPDCGDTPYLGLTADERESRIYLDPIQADVRKHLKIVS